MNPMNDPKVHRPGPVHNDRRFLQERRSLSESLADGTSKFFSLIVAKKNGFFSDISSKIEATFALKSDISNNSNGIDESVTAHKTHNCTNNNRHKSARHLNKEHAMEENGVNKMPSLPVYVRANSKPDRGGSAQLRNRGPLLNERKITSHERFSLNGVSVSFDEPIYYRPELNSSFPVTNISVSDTISCGSKAPRTKHTSGSKPKPEPGSHKRQTTKKHSSTTSNTGNCNHSGSDTSKKNGNPISREKDQSREACKRLENQAPKVEGTNIYADKTAPYLDNNNTFVEGIQNCGDIIKMRSNIETKSINKCTTCPDKIMDETSKKHTSTFTTTKRRSNTIDEILFDDYIKPEVDVIIPKENPNENLIWFEPELKVQQKTNNPSVTSENKASSATINNVNSSNGELGGAGVHRTASFGSEKSWSSVYSVDSQPDDVTIECMDFMKIFVDKIFHSSEDISQTEKAKFGELCQHFAGRLWFSRYVSSQRVHHKKVTETVFYSLMQYFAVCLFECYEADDFSPAKTLMNMCFTFNREEQTEKIFLYMCMREQPIWQSLRFWNAAYFDAVQCERARQPMPTNSDESETVSDDKQFQENITFGQLGTFACNMREFGLSKELCLEFLRKQSTIANLGKEQVKLLRENIERVKDI